MPLGPLLKTKVWADGAEERRITPVPAWWKWSPKGYWLFVFVTGYTGLSVLLALVLLGVIAIPWLPQNTAVLALVLGFVAPIFSYLFWNRPRFRVTAGKVLIFVVIFGLSLLPGLVLTVWLVRTLSPGFAEIGSVAVPAAFAIALGIAYLGAQRLRLPLLRRPLI